MLHTRSVPARATSCSGWALLLTPILLASACASQNATLTTSEDLHLTEIIQRIQVLSSPSLAGRGNGTEAALAAADSIARWLAGSGLTPAGDQGGWSQDFPLRGEQWQGKSGRNVVGLLPGRGALAGRYLVIGAHYDHLGRVADGGPAGSEPSEGDYYPGADDNASGVTILIELARLANREQAAEEEHRLPVSSRSCLFVAFAGEEIGLQGSGYFVKHLPVHRDSIDVMLNLDSVGRLREDRLYVAGVGTAAVLPQLVQQANQDSLVLELSRGGWDASDHVSFNTSEVPVLFLFTGAHPDYHRPTDTWRTLAPEDLGRVASYVQNLMVILRVQPGSFTYQPVDEIGSRSTDPEVRPERKAWLGAIPDFTEEAEGVKLAGVIAGSPADSVGLAKGDVLIGLAGKLVADLAEFAQILRAHAPGEQVSVLILRDGRRLVLEVVLADRSQR